MYWCFAAYLYVHMCAESSEARRDIKSSGAGVIGCSGLLGVSAGNRILCLGLQRFLCSQRLRLVPTWDSPPSITPVLGYLASSDLLRCEEHKCTHAYMQPNKYKVNKNIKK